MRQPRCMVSTLCLATLVLSACTVDEPAAGDAVGARFDAALLDMIPALVIDGEARDPSSLADRMTHHGVPGVSIAIADGGEIVWARGYGLADVSSQRPVTPETLFQAASISKPVAATAALSLVDEGRLGLDDDINSHLRSWAVPANEHTADAPVTLRALATHTAGLTVHGFPGYDADAAVPDTVAVLDGAGNTPAVRVDTPPRTLWRYSGGGYTVLQLLVEDLAGRPFPEVMRERVLEPLAMSRSTYEQPLPVARRAEAATAYHDDGTPYSGSFHTYPEMAAAGLWTTPSDLARWAIALQAARAGGDHPVLTAALVEAMLTPDLNGWGLGPQIHGGGRYFGHGGSNAGFRCNLVALRDGDQVLAVMTNSDNGGVLGQEVLLTVAAALGWEGIEPTVKEVAAIDPPVLAAFAGIYRGEALPGDIEITVDGRGLRATAAWDGTELELLPQSATEFFDRNDGRTVRFAVDDDGAPTGFEVRGVVVRRVGEVPRQIPGAEIPPAAGAAPSRPRASGQVPATPFDVDAAVRAYLDSVPAADRERSDAYFEGGYWLQMWGFLYGLAIAWLLLARGWSAALRDRVERLIGWKPVQTAIYAVGYLLITSLLGLPLAIYQGYVREHQYGLATQSFGPWFGEQLLALGVGAIVMPLVLVVLYGVFRRAERTWWLWGTVVALIFAVIGSLIGPVYIAPLFNTYEAVSDPEVRDPVLAMARANGVPANDVFVFDASRQSTRISANVSGIGTTMRISLNDNLLNRTSIPEIQSVMGHELGHYVLNHVYEGLMFTALVIAGGFAFVGCGFDRARHWWGHRWGVQGIGDVAGLPLLVALLSVYSFVLTPVTNSFIRANEAEADAFGINASRQPDGFAEVALKLGEYRKLDPGPWEEIIFFDHPSGRARIEMAMRWKAAND